MMSSSYTALSIRKDYQSLVGYSKITQRQTARPNRSYSQGIGATIDLSIYTPLSLELVVVLKAMNTTSAPRQQRLGMWFARLRGMWRRLFDLSGYGVDVPEEHLRRARALHQLTFVGLLSTLLAAIGLLMFSAEVSQYVQVSLRIAIGVCVIYVVAMLLNRRAHYYAAVSIVMMVIGVLPYVGSYAMAQFDPSLHLLHLLAVFSVLIVSVLFSDQRAVFVVGLLNLIAVFILHKLVQNVSQMELYVTMLMTVGITGFVIAFNRYRSELERARRAELMASNNELRRLSDGLTKILNVTDELLMAPTLDQLWKRGTELARELFDLDRNSIFEYDDEHGILIGTYGTNMAGETVDEHNKRMSLAERVPWIADALKKGERPWIVKYDQELREFRDGVNRVVGRGWIVYTLISHRNGKHAAIMFNDGSIHNRPVNPITQDLVGVYCTLLGEILEQKRTEQALNSSRDSLSGGMLVCE